MNNRCRIFKIIKEEKINWIAKNTFPPSEAIALLKTGIQMKKYKNCMMNS
jgi:hypothetical protein